VRPIRYFCQKQIKRKDCISPFNIINNINFWENVVFSDEKTFQSYSNGRVRVYRPVGERFSEQYVHKIKRSGRFSVNVWGWVSSRGTRICVVEALVYRDILKQALLPLVLPALEIILYSNKIIATFIQRI
jgi:hypothetical protein